MKLCTTTADLEFYAKTPAEAVRLFKDTGFKCLDLNFYRMSRPGSLLLVDNWQKCIEDVAVAAEEIGARFVQAHSPDGNPFAEGEEYDRFILSTIRSIEACGMLGIENIVVHSVIANFRTPRLGRQGYLDANKRFYETFFPVMEKTGVNVLIENTCEQNAVMPYDEKPGMSEGLFYYAEDMLELIEYIDHPLLHACWDTGHAAMRKMNQYDALTKLGSHLRAVHIQDNFGEHDEHIAPFMGVMNMDEIMCGLIDAGFRGYFTFEASNLLRCMNAWPVYRREWTRETRLANPPKELMQKAVGFLYDIGKSILSAYDVYEY